MSKTKLLVLPIILALSGCISITEPYPPNWAGLEHAGNSCTQLNGVYNGIGDHEVATARESAVIFGGPIELTGFLMPPQQFKDVDSTNRVQLIVGDGPSMTVLAFHDSELLATTAYPMPGLSLSCRHG